LYFSFGVPFSGLDAQESHDKFAAKAAFFLEHLGESRILVVALFVLKKRFIFMAGN
jgi:hypothetical protein